MSMKLQELNIELQRWGEDEGKYKGKIKYLGDKGSVEMQLSPKVSDALLLCIGDVITKFATESTNQVRDSLIQSVDEARKVPLIDINK